MGEVRNEPLSFPDFDLMPVVDMTSVINRRVIVGKIGARLCGDVSIRTVEADLVCAHEPWLSSDGLHSRLLQLGSLIRRKVVRG